MRLRYWYCNFFALIVVSVSYADVFPLLQDKVGESRPDNRIWMQYQTKRHGEQCKHWDEKVCKSNTCPDCTELCKPCQVRYLTGHEREIRRLRWDQKRKVWMGADNKPYDTKRDVIEHKSVAVGRDDVEVKKKWNINHMPSIWVVDLKGNLYASTEQKPGSFHHSSFLAGGSVQSAGQALFVNGVIKRINNFSGHYQPSERSLVKLFPLLNISDLRIASFYGKADEETQSESEEEGEGEAPRDFQNYAIVDDSDEEAE